jgi:hypothetical protein
MRRFELPLCSSHLLAILHFAAIKRGRCMYALEGVNVDASMRYS